LNSDGPSCVRTLTPPPRCRAEPASDFENVLSILEKYRGELKVLFKMYRPLCRKMLCFAVCS
jgi:hypothetical protein